MIGGIFGEKGTDLFVFERFCVLSVHFGKLWKDFGVILPVMVKSCSHKRTSPTLTKGL